MGNPPKSPQFDWEMYRYVPSLVGAAIALVVFAIMTSLHVWQWVRTRKHLIIYVAIGGLCEMTGFASRIGSHYDKEAWAPFIMQGTFLLVGPLFFAATIYMMLGRTVRLAGGEDVSLIKPKWYSRIFVGADIATLCIQGTGAGIMGTMKLKVVLAGNRIVIAGLALQTATFVFFVIAAVDFHVRMNRKETAASSLNDWKKMLWILYTVSTLILFRCTLRLIEYAMGDTSYLVTHEWALYTFDAVPMFLVLVLLLVLQPTKYVEESRKLSERSGSEELGMRETS